MRTQYNVDKMYTYLRGFLVGADMKESLKALQFARQKHKDQVRKNGTPYIVHPLRMACYAVAIGIKDDNIIATVLLHDVVEDTNVTFDELEKNFSPEVIEGLKLLTHDKNVDYLEYIRKIKNKSFNKGVKNRR